MFARFRYLKIAGLVLFGILAAYALFGYFVLPGMIQDRAEQYVVRETGHRLTLDRPEFDPFTLDLRVPNLLLEEPDGKPLVSFRELKVDLSASSLYKRALVFDSIRLSEPKATIVLLKNGKSNWSALIEALATGGGSSGSALPRLEIRHFVLSGGRIDFTDRKAFLKTAISPIDLSLDDVFSLPNDAGSYTLSAHTPLGASLRLNGHATLDPVRFTGSANIIGLDLKELSPYFAATPLVSPLAKIGSISAEYTASYGNGRFDAAIRNLSAKLTGLNVRANGPLVVIDKIEAGKGSFDLAREKLALGSLVLNGIRVDLPHHGARPLSPMKIGRIALQDAKVDLARRNIELGRMTVENGKLSAARNKAGGIDMMDALKAMPNSKLEGGRARKQAPDWHYRVKKFALSGFSADFKDDRVAPPAALHLDRIAVSADGIADKGAFPVRVSMHSKEGGSLEADGKIAPDKLSADLHLKLTDLALKPAQPYIASVARLALLSGKLGTEGRATYGKNGAGYKGGFELQNLRLVEAGTKTTFVAWRSLGTRSLDATPSRLRIGQLDIDRLDTRLIINKDRTVNIAKILKKTGKSAPSSKAQTGKSPFQVRIHRIRIRRSGMDFADYSLALPFATRIHKLHGFINNLSSRPGTAGQVDLSGQVNRYGYVKATGQINFFSPTDFTDIHADFKNIEMTRLTPYSATFAGRKIDSGKLSLNLEYKIRNHELVGNNQVVMDHLTLGERVESPQARDLPLDLAIAVLQDSDGRIDLGLPVSGNLDDPQFSYGSIVWKAILNVFGRIVTAPFHLLGALLGGSSGGHFENIVFEPGHTHLLPPEKEKLTHLADALNKRPGLSLTVHGIYSDADRVALQDLYLRRTVAMKAGRHLRDREDPGPLSTGSRKVRSALEDLFADRFDSAELESLKEGFRKANPGELKESAGSKLMTGLADLVRKRRTLDRAETDRMKGADFYRLLFERLREKETVDASQLESMGASRGENIIAGLKSAGAPIDRISLAQPEKIGGSGKGVAAKLELGTASKPAPPK